MKNFLALLSLSIFLSSGTYIQKDPYEGLPTECKPLLPSPKTVYLSQDNGWYCETYLNPKPGENYSHIGGVTCIANYVENSWRFEVFLQKYGSVLPSKCEEPIDGNSYCIFSFEGDPMVISKKYYAFCTNERVCENPTDCCKITSRQEVNEKIIEPEFDQVRLDKFELELYNNRVRRKEICTPYCTSDRFKDLCNTYWDKI